MAKSNRANGTRYLENGPLDQGYASSRVKTKLSNTWLIFFLAFRWFYITWDSSKLYVKKFVLNNEIIIIIMMMMMMMMMMMIIIILNQLAC